MEAQAHPHETKDGESVRRKAPPHRSRVPLWVIFVAGVLVVAGAYGVYNYEQSGPRCPTSNTIVVDVYDSFMGSGNNPNASRATVFNGFEKATGSCLTVNYLQTDVANVIASSPSSQLPDVAIGLTEVTAEQLGIEGLLVPYAPPGLASVNSSLVNEISPEHFATPYEWQYLGVDYLRTIDNSSGHAFSKGDVFQPLLSNTSLAKGFLYENPTTDPVGKEFLLWQYQFYTSVLHQNWTSFWKVANPNLPTPVTDWSTGIGEFGTGYPLFVSFGTDPAYFATYPNNISMNTSFSLYDGVDYAWETIYGAAIVKGGVHNLALDEKFVNWLLSPTVQGLIPLNEWMYPANKTIPLPPVFSVNPSVDHVVPLNSFTTPRAIAANLTGLLVTWQSLA